MFYNCSSLTEIKISSLWNTSIVTAGGYMFEGSTHLPNFDRGFLNVNMAKPTTEGGYLTLV